MRFFGEDGYPSDEEVEESTAPRPQRLVEGINLKDYIEGKDVTFQFNQDYDESIDDLNLTDDEYMEPSTIDKLRGKRGPSHVNESFSSISASMVSLDPNGYVKKEVITHGSGSLPPDYSRVLVHYNFYKEKEEEPFDSTYLRGKPCRLILNLGEMIPGLEIAIKSMKKGENSRFLIKWEVAFGKQGCPPRIGKECDILADVTLMDYTETVKQDCSEITEEDINAVSFGKVIREAKNCHCLGNEEFSSGDIKGAIKSYRKCVNMLNDARLTNEEEESKMLNLKVKCLVNLAICYNKIGRFENACVVCRDALSVEPQNVKAIFQYGKANLRLSNLGIAEKWLIKAKKLKPEDKDITEEIEKLHLKKESAKLEDTLFCQRAFRKLNVNSNPKDDA